MDINKRSAEEVFNDHLRLRKEDATGEDIARNYAEDCTILTSFGTFYGHQGVRQTAKKLSSELPDGTFEYETKIVDGRTALLVWTGKSEGAAIDDGVDSFIIEDGAIQVQTIHYRVVPEP